MNTHEEIHVDLPTECTVTNASPSPSPPRRRMSGQSTPRSKGEVFQRNILGILNKRGYNVRDSVLAESSETSTAQSSFTSNASSISSVILNLREPNHGQGPLHIAVRKGDCQVLDALLDNNWAEEIVNVQDYNGNTALHFAAGSWRRSQCLAMVESLLAAGADVAVKNKRGLTPIAVHMLTIQVDNPTVLIKLLEYGSDPNTEVEGSSLMHIAARRELAVIAGVLVGFNASFTALNQNGLMCYEVASKRLKHFMLRSIHAPPPYLSPTERSKCMRCSSALLTPKKVIKNFLKKILGLKISSHQCNCYHCGLLYCVQCLKPSQASEMIPFVRPHHDSSNIKTCRLCEAILRERLHKHRAQETFDKHLMGFGPGA